MSTDLMPFTYEGVTVRTVIIDGEPWFVLADLCAVLGIRNAADVRRRLDDAGVDSIDIRSGGQMRSVTVVNEPNMYEVVIRSDKPEAVNFRRWLTGEVLPTIRKTGGAYIVPGSQAELDLTNPDTALDKLIEVAQIAKAERAQRIALEEKVAEDAPKVNYVDLYVAESDLLKVRVVAANNDVGEEWLRDLLVAKGWIYIETESRWSNSKGCMEIRRRYSAYAHKRPYFRPVEVHEAPRFKGEVMHTLKVTPAGAEAISRLIERERAA